MNQDMQNILDVLKKQWPIAEIKLRAIFQEHEIMKQSLKEIKEQPWQDSTSARVLAEAALDKCSPDESAK